MSYGLSTRGTESRKGKKTIGSIDIWPADDEAEALCCNESLYIFGSEVNLRMKNSENAVLMEH